MTKEKAASDDEDSPAAMATAIVLSCVIDQLVAKGLIDLPELRSEVGSLRTLLAENEAPEAARLIGLIMELVRKP